MLFPGWPAFPIHIPIFISNSMSNPSPLWHPAQAVLFDIGNVLLNFDFNRAAAAMAARSPLPAVRIRAELDAWQHRHESGHITSEEFSAGAREGIGFAGTEEEFRGMFCDIFTPNEPMWEFARSLFGRVPVYLFSNISFWHETWIFREYPEFNQFDGGFYSWRIGAMKPEPAFYRAALDTLPFAPEHVAYLDDMPLNVQGGREAGFRSCQYHHGQHAGFLEEARHWFQVQGRGEA